MIKEFERAVLDKLIKLNVIPFDGIFQIEESHLREYIKMYSELFGKSGNGLKTLSNARFARKLAGLTLLKLNFERNAKFNQLKSGLVYMIENPQFTDHYKLGMTIDLNSRLDSYQTYDPYRNFKVVKYDFVLNRSLTEKNLLNHHDITKECGEWIIKNNAIKIFEKICFIPR
jgi:hypothetical protein